LLHDVLHRLVTPYITPKDFVESRVVPLDETAIEPYFAQQNPSNYLFVGQD